MELYTKIYWCIRFWQNRLLVVRLSVFKWPVVDCKMFADLLDINDVCMWQNISHNNHLLCILHRMKCYKIATAHVALHYFILLLLMHIHIDVM